MTVYLDSAATNPVRREVLEAMWPFLTTEFGNPSSHHRLGESAALALRQARSTIAGVIGCRASELTFTSGGTEANNLAVKGIALASPRGRHIITSAIEHPSVLESCDYLRRFHDFEITVLPVDEFGVVSHVALQDALRPDTTLVTVMYANNEVGTVQSIAALAAVAAAKGVPFHSDAVQAAGWLPLDAEALGVDALTIAGHKLGAPKGVGVLFCRSRVPLEPVIHGGGQERGRRSGTENVAAIVGLATAVELAESERSSLGAEAAASRDAFIAEVLASVPGATLTGHPSARLPGSASFCFEGVSGESVLLELENEGIVCSSGSACAAGSDEPSSVLLALGVEPSLAQSAVRFTFSAAVTQAELSTTAESVRRAVETVRGIAR